MAAVGELCRQLLTKLKEVEVTSALCADVLLLSASDAAFLALAERAGPAFAEAWPEAQQLDAQAVAAPFLALAAEALRVDSRLQKRCDRLVPKRTTEASFWRCYSSALYALLLAPPAPASAAGEGAAEAAAGGVGAGGGGAGCDGASVTGGLKGDEASGAQHGGADGGDALGDELFFKPAKGALQSSGALKRAALLRLTDGLTVALGNEATRRDMAMRPAGEMAARCVQLQRQFIEQCGVEAGWGCAQLSQVPTRFANDVEVLSSFHAFTQSCRRAVEAALILRAATAASTGSQTRRFGLGARVMCFVGDRWEGGEVAIIDPPAPTAMGAPQGTVLPYQVRLDIGSLVFAPADHDTVIRAEVAADRNSPAARNNSTAAAGSAATAGARLPTPRFAVGTRVACRMKPGDPGEWATGEVVAHHFRHPAMPAGFAAPYQVKLAGGMLIFAPMDNDDTIRSLA